MNNEAEIPVIRVENVSFSYDSVPVLEDVNLSIGQKEFVWIVGPNGGGKTTLLKLILGLLKPKKGKIFLFGKEPELSLSRVGYMTQHARLDPGFPVSVLDVVLMGRLGLGRPFGPYHADDKAQAEYALSEVGLLDLMNRSYSSLSGGQQRRLLIARALAGDPELIILDEPTASLDMLVEKELYELLQKLNERLTIITVSHDPTFVSDFVKRAVCVNRYVHEHPTSEINGSLVSDIYRGGRRIVRHDKELGGE